MLVTENQLDEWVRGNARDAQGVIVELVWRLVAASSPRPKERRFPLGDSIGQPGPDGILDADFAFDPFVPEGRSFWEIGTGLSAGAKATSDYTDLVTATPEHVRLGSVFVFVTPLSGRREWPHTWKEDAQASWLEERRKRDEWRGVRVIDGTKLIDWLREFPSVGLWLAQTMGLSVQQIETPEQRWRVLRTIGDPPPLTSRVFLANREAACAKLKEVFAGTTIQLKLDTHFPDQIADFVCAYVADMDEEARIDALGRCLVISGIEGWNEIAVHRERHILVADFDLDEGGRSGTKLLEKARRAGHAVIFGGRPGGRGPLTRIARRFQTRRAIKSKKLWREQDIARNEPEFSRRRVAGISARYSGVCRTYLCCRSGRRERRHRNSPSQSFSERGTKHQRQTAPLWRASRETLTGSGSGRCVRLRFARALP